MFPNIHWLLKVAMYNVFEGFFLLLFSLFIFLFLHCSSVKKCCSLGISILFGLKFLTDQGIQNKERQQQPHQ